MLMAVNEKLVLFSQNGSNAVGYSKVFGVPFPDNIGEFAIILVTVVGPHPVLTAVLEATNDRENWTDVETIGPLSISAGQLESPTITLEARDYRVRWTFKVDGGSDGSCILAASIETSHG